MRKELSRYKRKNHKSWMDMVSLYYNVGGLFLYMDPFANYDVMRFLRKICRIFCKNRMYI